MAGVETYVSHANVVFEVVVRADGPWGDNCSLGQVVKQSRDQAQNTLYKLLGPGSGTDDREKAAAKVDVTTNGGKILGIELVPKEK